MSSSRILSSRPSASCITAKPIARMIRGRGRNASPFFAAQKLGKMRAFPPEPAGDTALWLSVPETARSIAGALWGHKRFRITPPEAGKPNGLFRQSLPGTLLYGSPSRKPHSPLLGRCGGTGASAPPSRKWGSRGGFSVRARRGHCFMARCPGTLTVHRRCCGAMDASAPSRREWEPCHKRKKRRKLPPLF